MSQVLTIALVGPPSRGLLAEGLVGASANPFAASFPLIAQLAVAYCELGHRVIFVTTSDRVGRVAEYRGCHERLRIVCVPRRKTRCCMLDLYRREVALLAGAIRDCAPDVVHALWTYEYADAALRSGCPTLVTAHDSPWRIAWLLKRPLRIERAVYSQFCVLPRVRHLSTVSPYMARALRGYHFYRRPIALIPNGLPRDRFVDRPRDGVRDALSPVIAGVSEWYPLKNPAMLFSAFKEVRKLIPGARLIVFGHGFEPSGPAARYAEKHGVVEGVEYCGYAPAEEIRLKLKREADVFLHPTREESFGMTFLEAMSLGIPCVGGVRSGAVPWLLDNGRAGLLVDVEDCSAVSAALLSLLRNDEDYRRISAAGLQYARASFVLEAVASQYVQQFQSLRGSNG